MSGTLKPAIFLTLLILFICKKNSVENLKKALSPLITISLQIENQGSKLIYHDNNIY